jgi:hypothetical protein
MTMQTTKFLGRSTGLFALVLWLALPLSAQELDLGVSNPGSNLSIQFLSPTYAQALSKWDVDVVLKYRTAEARPDVQVKANGQDVTDMFQKGDCDNSGCLLHGSLRVGVQLKSGWNYLIASVQDDSGAATSTRLQFEMNAKALSPTDGSAAPYAVPIKMNPDSTIVVGYTPEDGNVPHTYPDSRDRCDTSHILTLVVLNRATLGWEATRCFTAGQNSELQTYLSTLSEADLVLGNGSQGKSFGDLDMTEIGGTDWTRPPFGGRYISDYSIIGYGKGSKGIATETYNDLVRDNSSRGKWRGPNGNLINVSPNNVPAFSYRATDPVGFAIIPNGGTATVTIGNVNTFPTGPGGTPPGQTIPAGFTSTTYTSPPLTGDSAGVWILVLDRYSLALRWSDTFSAYNSNGTANTSQLRGIYNSLNGAKHTDLVFIAVLKGSNIIAPAMQTEKIDPINTFWAITQRISAMGVPELAFNKAMGNQWSMGLNTASFSMVGVPDSARFNPDQWYSSEQDIPQGETGTLVGTLTRDRSNKYAPANVHPYNTARLGPNWSVNDLLSDSLSEAIASAAPVQWPLYDTPGHKSAYAYLSQQLVRQALYGGGECLADPRYCRDIRFYYTGSAADTIVKGAKPDQVPVPSRAVAEENGFEPDDYTAVVVQIKLELSYLGNVYAYQQWFQSVNTDAGINIASNLVTAATKVASDLNIGTGQPTTEIEESKLDLASKVLKIAGGASSALTRFVPQFAVASGVFSAGAGILDFISDYNKTAPQPDPYVTQLSDLLGEGAERAQGAAGKFNHDMQESTATFFNGIYSDWFKLQTVGLMSINPDAPAWYRQQSSSNLSTGIGPSLIASARRSFYMQTVSQYFGRKTVDFVAAKATANPLIPGKYPTVENLDHAITRIAGVDANRLSAYSWARYDMVPQQQKGNVVTTDGWWTYQYAVLKKNTSAPWRDPLGTVLMGPANSATGEGNLNIPREVVFNGAITFDLGTYKGPEQ